MKLKSMSLLNTSYWEQQSFTDYDYVIVGGGISGCFTALTLAQLNPNKRIAILESGLFPNGASTKNAGFACFGSLTELEADLEQMSETALVDLVSLRYEGLQRLRASLGDREIGYKADGGYELFFDAQPTLEQRIERMNELLFPLFRKRIFQTAQHQIKHCGFSSAALTTCVFNPLEGTLDTGKMMWALQQKLMQMGVKIFTQTPLIDFEETPSKISLRVKTLNDHQQLNAQQVAFCTNAFSKEWFPKEEIFPGRGTIVVTNKIEGLTWEGGFHYYQGYRYFRTVDGRLLLGGGRELDLKGEQTTAFGINPQIKAALLEDIKNFILPNTPFTIDYEWSGIMAFGRSKKPIVKRITPRIVLGARLGGMGVSIGSEIGKATADLLMTQ